MSLHVLILGGARTPPETETPALLAEHHSALMLERLIAALAPLDAHIAFAIGSGALRRFRMNDIIALAAPGAAVIPIERDTQGAACTALLCIDHIDPDGELLILNANEYVDADYAAIVEGFRARSLDAGVVTFPSLHPRYSYVLLDAAGAVVEAAEKRPISRHATAGFYWFARGGLFIDAVKAMIRKDVHVDGRFFISLTFNELVLQNRRIGTTGIAAACYLPLKSPRQIRSYEQDAHPGESA